MVYGWSFSDVKAFEDLLVKANFEQLEYMQKIAGKKLAERKIQQSLRAAQEVAYGF